MRRCDPRGSLPTCTRERARCGTGYLRFAQAETGLFRTAFATAVDVEDAPAETKSGQSGLNPFELLGAALDRLVEAGAMPPEHRPGAEFLAWSAVHGLALLIIDGPLRGMPRRNRRARTAALDMVEKGL